MRNQKAWAELIFKQYMQCTGLIKHNSVHKELCLLLVGSAILQVNRETCTVITTFFTSGFMHTWLSFIFPFKCMSYWHHSAHQDDQIIANKMSDHKTEVQT